MHGNTKRVFVFLSLISVVVLFSSLAEASWLTGYESRKDFSISSDYGDLTNYQMLLTVYAGSGTDSGSDVYLDGNVQSDFDDLRFTSADGETELYYWIEDYVAGNYAKVWVQCDSIAASPDTSSFYLYYDNPEATTGESLTEDHLEQACNWYGVGPTSSGEWSDTYAYDGDYSLHWHVDSMPATVEYVGVRVNIDIGDWLDKGSSVTFRVRCSQSNHALIYGYYSSDAGLRYFTTLNQGATSNWGLVTVPVTSTAYKTGLGTFNIYTYSTWSGWTAGQSFDLWVDSFSFMTRSVVNPEPTIVSWGNGLGDETVPEPASLLLLGFGVSGIAVFRRKIGS